MKEFEPITKTTNEKYCFDVFETICSLPAKFFRIIPQTSLSGEEDGRKHEDERKDLLGRTMDEEKKQMPKGIINEEEEFN